MVIAFVSLTTKSGTEKDTLEKIRELKVVKEAYLTYGPFDIIVKVVADNLKEFREILVDKIRTLENVRSINTTVIMEE